VKVEQIKQTNIIITLDSAEHVQYLCNILNRIGYEPCYKTISEITDEKDRKFASDLFKMISNIK
jgi:hypothetical protein